MQALTTTAAQPNPVPAPLVSATRAPESRPARAPRVVRPLPRRSTPQPATQLSLAERIGGRAPEPNRRLPAPARGAQTAPARPAPAPPARVAGPALAPAPAPAPAPPTDFPALVGRPSVPPPRRHPRVDILEMPAGRGPAVQAELESRGLRVTGSWETVPGVRGHFNFETHGEAAQAAQWRE